MTQINVNRVTNSNVYINGASLLGKAEEIDLPKIITKMAEHKALGMMGVIELPTGFEKMEARIKWNAVYGDIMAKMANPYETHSLQCRGNIENYTAGGRTGQVPYVCFFRGQFKELPAGNFKQHDNVEMESRLAVTYCKVEINSVSIVEFDVLANIFKVNGVDVLATYKANIGG